MSLKDDIKELQKELKGAKIEVSKTEPYNPQKQEDTTRSKMALIFVWGYFILLGGIIILAIINNIIVDSWKLRPESIINLKDIIPLVTSAIGTSLGFVVGYYFKSSENRAD